MHQAVSEFVFWLWGAFSTHPLNFDSSPPPTPSTSRCSTSAGQRGSSGGNATCTEAHVALSSVRQTKASLHHLHGISCLINAVFQSSPLPQSTRSQQCQWRIYSDQQRSENLSLTSWTTSMELLRMSHHHVRLRLNRRKTFIRSSPWGGGGKEVHGL
ncbi:hypothetical protein AALO_G00016890 [Alosa alosa]|uniref:Uncharacterized protein n=1 Tax=Alosa alosa TaxID=278164 RepID=A0AAV6HL07_9TELE|nr:hypothetical protein AALO_G00016890 [Alosa alosa]